MLTERDEDILWHVGLYRLTLRPVLAHAFGLSNPGNVLHRLRRANVLRERSGLPGRLSYYQLTEKAAAGRVPLDRTLVLGETALKTHLAVLWWCHFSRWARRRLELEDLDEVFGPDHGLPPQLVHCIDRKQAGLERRRMWRVYVPGPATRPRKVLRLLETSIRDVTERRNKVSDFLESRTYAFAVLTDSELRKKQLRDAVAQAGLQERAYILVDLAPTPASLSEFLRAQGRRRR